MRKVSSRIVSLLFIIKTWKNLKLRHNKMAAAEIAETLIINESIMYYIRNVIIFKVIV